MMPKVVEKVLCRQCHRRAKKVVKLFVVARLMYSTILNTVVFLIMNLKIIFIIKTLFRTVKNAFTFHVVSALKGYLIIKTQYNVTSAKNEYISNDLGYPAKISKIIQIRTNHGFVGAVI